MKKAQSVVIMEKENCWLCLLLNFLQTFSFFLFNPLEILLMMIKQNVYNPQPQSNAKIADLMKKNRLQEGFLCGRLEMKALKTLPTDSD